MGKIRLGGDEKNGPKRRKTRHLGHRYVNFLPSCLTYFFCFFLGSVHVLKRQGGFGWAAM